MVSNCLRHVHELPSCQSDASPATEFSCCGFASSKSRSILLPWLYAYDMYMNYPAVNQTLHQQQSLVVVVLQAQSPVQFCFLGCMPGCGFGECKQTSSGMLVSIYTGCPCGKPVATKTLPRPAVYARSLHAESGIKWPPAIHDDTLHHRRNS